MLPDYDTVPGTNADQAWSNQMDQQCKVDPLWPKEPANRGADYRVMHCPPHSMQGDTSSQLADLGLVYLFLHGLVIYPEDRGGWHVRRPITLSSAM